MTTATDENHLRILLDKEKHQTKSPIQKFLHSNPIYLRLLDLKK